jgi:hypothetical protein
MRGIESTSFELDYIPSTSVKHHQQIPIHGATATARKKKPEYDSFDNISKSKRKTKVNKIHFKIILLRKIFNRK